MLPKAFKDLSRTKQMKLLHQANAQQAQIINSFLSLCDPFCKYWNAVEKDTDDGLVLLAQKSETEGEDPTVVIGLNFRILEDICSKLKIHLAGGQVESDSK